MDTQLLRMFQRQVRLQCEYTLVSAAEIGHAQNAEELFLRIQNFLYAAGNIAKAFWGSGGYMAKDRKELRESVGLSEDSVLKSVAMRSNFEYFDERLDRWWSASPGHGYIDMNISDGSLIASQVDNIDMFRFYNRNTTELIFWGEKFNISSIVREVEKILPRLREEEGKSYENRK